MPKYQPPEPHPELSVPENWVSALKDYFDPNDGVYKRTMLTGSTRAVLENNLEAAMAKSDLSSQRAMPDIVMYLRSFTPREAWGSHERVEAWIAKCAEQASG